ncbi:superoxide dismutase [Bradyrhizobium sp.]|jgi:Fe-Mn family superoxide dismutase|uniref:superoxide dismutase n=1 Tax=Bradyrhizobium sp. TaxID=376 RepID=UPI002DFAB5B7|nr:superoxide dismutase [Bradyrhizobium sp.]
MSSLSRRHLFGAAAGVIAAAAAPRVFAQAPAAPAPAPAAAPAPTGPFTLPPLTYPFNALEPHIDAKTMEIHHDRHHAAYVANLNTIAKANPQIGTSAVQDVLGNLNALNDDIKFAVRNNLGGHANHTMFWEIMAPGGGKPEGELQTAIDKDLGGMDKFQTDFNAAGGRQFGSGWVFVTIAKEGKLAIETKPNQDSPIMDGKRVLLGNDVWEHAYYLMYQNRRADYLKAWWNTVNWSKVAERYAAAKAGTLGV